MDNTTLKSVQSHNMDWLQRSAILNNDCNAIQMTAMAMTSLLMLTTNKRSDISKNNLCKIA
jgi:hypothetical protein